jgi:hypothetical protein
MAVDDVGFEDELVRHGLKDGGNAERVNGNKRSGSRVFIGRNTQIFRSSLCNCRTTQVAI